MHWAMSIQPFPPAFSEKTAGLGGDSLGLNPDDGPLVLFLLSYNWANEADDDAANAAGKKLIAGIDAAAVQAGTFNRYKYLNYAAGWQDPLDGYGNENRQKLQTVSLKYDPTGVFQKNCPGGFKLFTTD